ncbi:50S ribosomal protein L36, partial [Eubacterium sp. AM28-29]
MKVRPSVKPICD